MRLFTLLILLSLVGCREPARPAEMGSTDNVDLHRLAVTDLRVFAERVAGSDGGSFDKARNVITWFAENFDWSATDYEQRTVQEILERGGGNCNELAMVAIASLDSLGLTMRKIREINIHVEDEYRQFRAEEKVAESGLRMSVFGRRHNDHVWIEILDESTGEWFPADPSLGLVGETSWLRARLSFGERFSLDPSSEDMIAPFAVFAHSAGGMLSRTRHYLIEGFDRLYAGRLRTLDSWREWEQLVSILDEKAAGAFGGTVNLHEYGDHIDRLAQAYHRMKLAYVSRYQELSPPT